jgi:hypothetical protein
MLTELDEYWNSGTSAWVNSHRYTYTYDANGNSITGKFEAWSSGNWTLNITDLPLYSNNNYIYDVYATRYEATYKSFTTGISEIAQNAQMLIYPNPSSDFITISLKNVENTHASIKIYNTNGSLVYTNTLNSNNQQINVSSFKAGIYFVELLSDNKTERQKIIINR